MGEYRKIYEARLDGIREELSILESLPSKTRKNSMASVSSEELTMADVAKQP